MAIEKEEKAEILYYLGYPAKVVDKNSLEYNSIINDRFESFPEEFEPIMRQNLSEIKALKERMIGSHNDLRVKQVSDIILNTDEMLTKYKSELRRLSKDLGGLMNIRYRSGSTSISVRY